MEWGDVRIFLALARAGSIGGAARRLGLSHPTVGRRLRALQDDTGQVLLQRGPQGLLLTEAGRAILQQAEIMELQALAIERRLAGEDSQPTGILRISASDWFGSLVLAPVIAELTRRFPRLVPELISEPRLFDLSRREADIVFRNVPFDDVDIVQRRLMVLEHGVYTARDQPDPTADGAGAALILVDTEQGFYPDTVWLQQKLPAANIAFRSNSRSAQARMCAQGVGLAVLPCVLAEHTSGLRRVDFDEPPPARTMWMGYHSDLRRMDRLRALTDLAVEMLAPTAEHS
ncbi:MAG TPA: LysR family transcriptional regulator [Frateuria sp.]|uniref:LysR family transcriptional regulator n=1 Tax=Frateuria sp. TaxID=2211372 RepID=UPI002DF1D3D9|nr:LysR family transcriptional regulator [Frateuria sp.]